MLQFASSGPRAIAFRDQHRNDMMDADWSAIELRLFKAYSKLRRSVNPPS
jgi:DNA polymerase I-like protein with 3'-5' exonuclease and polymerase domains